MVRDLRRRCPWDRVQTRETIRPYLIEEVFELDHAIAEGDAAAVREEVADLLLHLAWQLVLGEERGEFTPDEVAHDLETKMKRRHPHLFDLGPAERWENLKRKERQRGVLDGLPPALPALHLAYRLQERAAGVGSTGPTPRARSPRCARNWRRWRRSSTPRPARGSVRRANRRARSPPSPG
ncbi:MAG: hypothetical protein IPK12_09770 [Gemmatimonadetes bacterium]|nr:hypothetical protein [Gemmatimonadota bacterium]